jgi:hypothetical protein
VVSVVGRIGTSPSRLANSSPSRSAIAYHRQAALTVSCVMRKLQLVLDIPGSSGFGWAVWRSRPAWSRLGLRHHTWLRGQREPNRFRILLRRRWDGGRQDTCSADFGDLMLKVLLGPRAGWVGAASRSLAGRPREPLTTSIGGPTEACTPMALPSTSLSGPTLKIGRSGIANGWAPGPS